MFFEGICILEDLRSGGGEARLVGVGRDPEREEGRWEWSSGWGRPCCVVQGRRGETAGVAVSVDLVNPVYPGSIDTAIICPIFI